MSGDVAHTVGPEAYPVLDYEGRVFRSVANSDGGDVERWQWTDGADGQGASVIEEL